MDTLLCENVAPPNSLKKLGYKYSSHDEVIDNKEDTELLIPKFSVDHFLKPLWRECVTTETLLSIGYISFQEQIVSNLIVITQLVLL